MENSDADDETGWNCSVHPSVFFLLGNDLNVYSCMVFLYRLYLYLLYFVSDEEINLLGRVGFPTVQSCVNYLSGGIDGVRGYEPRADWQHRMQNLSISCALVCLIILGSAALIGAFGVFQHQISAVLVTGVMYLLAASFALFTLTIIHFKRLHSRPHMDESEGTVDGVVSPTGGRGVKDLLPARVFTTSWSLDLGWGGVMLCVMTSVLWILLSKIMRFNPISSMIN
uniref:Uncharacterized protein LOC114344231 n=1 Tax=Diabrotica virgifera virgifera TaxID=50390 RepID=A0A6P7GML1_DIAVI